MYATVPRAVPGLVRCSSTDAAVVALPRGSLGGQFRQPKVENLRVPTLGDEDVRGFDVAVNDALGVGRIQCIRNLDGKR